jgi:ElaB/YqjD/DUF883 family membrane-anchored ribosome-binding protein
MPYTTTTKEMVTVMNNQQIPEIGAIDTLKDDISALLAATADFAGVGIADARERLAAALKSGKTAIERAKVKAIDGVEATDRAVREHPYVAIGIAFGLGAILAYLCTHRRGNNVK